MGKKQYVHPCQETLTVVLQLVEAEFPFNLTLITYIMEKSPLPASL